MRARALLAVALAPLLVGCPAVDESSNVSYDDRFDATKMDVFLPHDGRTQRPAVLFIHGGGWLLGTKDEFLVMARRLAGSGYVTATINYRLVPDGAFPRAIQDAKCALAFFRGHAAQYGLDPARVAAFGYSSGGHLAAMLGVSAGKAEIEADCASGATGPANAVIGGSGVYDLHDMTTLGLVSGFLGGSEAEVPRAYELASPIEYVRFGLPPFLLTHGGADWVVPESQSFRMRDALRTAGGEARFLELTDSGHVLAASPDSAGLEIGADADDRPEVWSAVFDFLSSTIGSP